MVAETKGYLPPLVTGDLSPREYLAINGYFQGDFPTEKLKETDPLFKRATIEFQGVADLVQDGEFGPVCQNKTKDKRCALPDLNRGFVFKKGKWVEFNVESACQRKWSDSVKHELTCCHNLSFSTISNSDLDKAWWECFRNLMAVCDIGFKRVPYTTKANFYHNKKLIDGRSKTLAYHYLCGCNVEANEHLQGVFDSGESWNYNFFLGVGTHEVIHGLGFSHSTDPKDLEYPYYRSNIIKPQAGDIRRLQSVYGKPVNQPSPDPTPTTPTTLEALAQRVNVHEFAIEILGQRLNELERRLQ